MRQVLIGTHFGSIDCKGYTEEELEVIARVYNINLHGQLKAFLAEMGRSDGGLIGDSMIMLYRSHWRVRQHLLFQMGLFDNLQEAGLYDQLNRPFVVAVVSENYYYYMQTKLTNDVVFLYDANEDTVTTTEYDLIGLLRDLALHENRGHSELGLCTSGDLLTL